MVVTAQTRRYRRFPTVDGTRRCTRCLCVKPVFLFPGDSRYRDYIKPECSSCNNRQRLKWARRNPERDRQIKRAWAARKRQRTPTEESHG